MQNDSELFDRWAEAYDSSVESSPSFPFVGYEKVLHGLLSSAEVTPGMSVLDLGTGTGAVAGRFLRAGCQVWATDFSPKMIAKAQAKFPSLTCATSDLRDLAIDGFPSRYDRIVSGYALHHLDFEGKLELITDMALNHLLPGGRILVADVAFLTTQQREQAAQRLQDLWDPTEYYWAADETTQALSDLGYSSTFTQVSFCAGYFSISPRP